MQVPRSFAADTERPKRATRDADVKPNSAANEPGTVTNRHDGSDRHARDGSGIPHERFHEREVRVRVDRSAVVIQDDQLESRVVPKR
jgi:hypothetical protein